jgi:hypothetical protein
MPRSHACGAWPPAARAFRLGVLLGTPMTCIVFNPAGEAIRKWKTPRALIFHARVTKPQRVRLDREHRLLEMA